MTYRTLRPMCPHSIYIGLKVPLYIYIYMYIYIYLYLYIYIYIDIYRDYFEAKVYAIWVHGALDPKL